MAVLRFGMQVKSSTLLLFLDSLFPKTDKYEDTLRKEENIGFRKKKQ